MTIESATDKVDAAGLRGREMSVRHMYTHTQEDTFNQDFVL